MVRSSPISAKIGVAPTDSTALAVATYENDGTITSSPLPTSKASRDAWRAAVPELTATACLAPVKSRTARSSRWTTGPPSLDGEVSVPDSSTDRTARASRSSSRGLLIGMNWCSTSRRNGT